MTDKYADFDVNHSCGLSPNEVHEWSRGMGHFKGFNPDTYALIVFCKWCLETREIGL